MQREHRRRAHAIGVHSGGGRKEGEGREGGGAASIALQPYVHIMWRKGTTVDVFKQ